MHIKLPSGKELRLRATLFRQHLINETFAKLSAGILIRLVCTDELENYLGFLVL